MIAETMSLGIMSLPKAMNTLGLIVGPILIILFGLISFLCGMLIWKVKLKHPGVASYCEIMTTMYGKTGKWFTTIDNSIVLIFVMVSAIPRAIKRRRASRD